MTKVQLGTGDLVSRSYGGEAQGRGHEALAHSGGSHQQYVLVFVQELQGEDGVQEPAVEGDGRRPVEVLQAAGLLEAGALKPQFNAPVGAAMSWEWVGLSRAFIPATFAGQG